MICPKPNNYQKAQVEFRYSYLLFKPMLLSYHFSSLVLGNILNLKPGWTERNSSIYLRRVIGQVQKEADIVHGAIFFKVRFEEPGSFHVYLNRNDFISAGRRNILNIMYFWWRLSYRSALFLPLKLSRLTEIFHKNQQSKQSALNTKRIILTFYSQMPNFNP